MSGKRHSVKEWEESALQAASMSVGICMDTDGELIAIDMHTQNNAVFAHGHFDVDTAEKFYRALGESIQLCRARRNPQ